MDNAQLFVITVVIITLITVGGGISLAIVLYKANSLMNKMKSVPAPDVIPEHGGHEAGLMETTRTDRWWFEPTWTGLGFLCFVIYANWAGFQGEHYWHGSYLSPFYSPVLFVDTVRVGAAPIEHAWFGLWPDWLRTIWPPFFPTSPAWLILAGPLAFRLTCYYYRKFYYRAYFLNPAACAVGAMPSNILLGPNSDQKYKGETALFLFQNLHRFTWYLAVVYIGLLSWDGFLSLWEGGKLFKGEFGIGVGSIILIINPLLLATYTFGCHSCRHLVGGRKNSFSGSIGARIRFSLWKKATWLNQRHMLCAWMSMIWVGFSDFYVRMCSMGIINDINTW
ncbi:MAG TPA: succinate dehydrogenase [Chloroflexi bacterium]|nr:succinate dehydrogenase [Chloroflexota bacterium]|tara:strand:+ start:2403 stop:3410 length:1008 start_codon:yes stop_codon:yes gene_type:complete